jgi:hypothetical protein
VVGVEVKAGATVRGVRGLRLLRERLGDAFRAGVVLWTGAETPDEWWLVDLG